MHVTHVTQVSGRRDELVPPQHMDGLYLAAVLPLSSLSPILPAYVAVSEHSTLCATRLVCETLVALM